jgi:oligopeptide/dipeptide ABC transporter ATP-binding protein
MSEAELPTLRLAMADARPVLNVQDLKVHFPIRGGVLNRQIGTVYAVDGISLALQRGRTLGLVGESGCGKSTVGKAIVRLVEPTAGAIWIDGTDITRLGRAAMRPLRRRVQMVFQDPYSSLNPRMSIADLIAEPLENFQRTASRAQTRERSIYLLSRVGLRADAMGKYPHQFSGGQRQRLGIARALAADPGVIIADEPVSALDVSVQAQVLNLLAELQQEFGLAYLFISHDLAVVKHISDDIAVMYLGRMVETASRRRLFASPLHPYTQALLAAAPVARPGFRQPTAVIEGEVPSPSRPPPGCRFHTRCPQAIDVCRSVEPTMQLVQAGHAVACHRVSPHPQV